MTAQFFRITCKRDGQHIRESMLISTHRHRPIAKSCTHNMPDLLLDDFATLEKLFRPAGHCFVDTSPTKHVHDIANRGAEFAPVPMSCAGPSRQLAQCSDMSEVEGGPEVRRD
ncbi:hypothetical protein [Bradyrhizobium sp. LTSPM299]|uniref:hypothetical protein n=1 Tax=Bradyrhizobium sp. LTSPM299 TaxID=1619233 RepID=UPI0012E31EBD|nr:hypothetical protein [Bradyrhizobium sp. LTSPM299]